MDRSFHTPSDRELLARISRSSGGKAGYKQLIRELGLGGGRERRLLLEQLGKLVANGALQLSEDSLWSIPRPPVTGVSTEIYAESTPSTAQRGAKGTGTTLSASGRERLASGRLELHRDGFGFVRPDPSGSGAARASGDIFVPPGGLRGAMHGDLVLVEEEAPDREGRRSGRVARVLTRRNTTVVGIFHVGRNARRRANAGGSSSPGYGEGLGNYVAPWDERLGDAIEIPPGAEFPVESGPSPHRTLGTEAALAPDQRVPPGILPPSSKDGGASLDGLAVEVEITSFATPGRPAMGRVLEVLGPPDAFGVDVEIVIRKHGIPHTFPAHVLAEADERAQVTIASLPQGEAEAREDFRGLPIVTIDGETARDFDDAVLVRELPDGGTELQVHIADVSSYVTAGSALDLEARVRGTSVYFPDRAVPMLPHALSSGMCSLLPNEDRLVLSCVMEIDERGEVVRYRVAEGIIRSARRMTYTSVQQCLNASPAAATWNKYDPVTPKATAEDQSERERIGLEQPALPDAFDRMLELALRLNRKRVRRGSIDFDLPEPVIEFDPDGNMKAVVRSERGWAHRLIEEFMLSANECVATWLTAQGIASIYRIHEMPDPKRIVDFEETAAAFGQTLGIGALPVKRLTMKSDRREAQRSSARGRDRGPAKTHELPERIPVTPQMYQKLIRKIQGKPEERILSYLMLRSLKQAKYSEKNEGHFALASPCYTHFTSPIRRYPDLIVHRLVRAMLRRDANPQGGALLSTDPQPWKVEREQTHSRHAADAGAAIPMRVARTKPAKESVPERFSRSTAKKRAGRIGWSQSDGDGSGGEVLLPQRAEVLDEEVPRQQGAPEPIAAAELADIAVESSQAERRASDAERELIEWKKMKFMADRIGDDFTGIILSVTKFGFFVELDELFIEGLVPLGSIAGDFYSFRDADRVICGARTGHCFRVGDSVDVILDRIDRQQRRLQFALTPGTEPKAEAGTGSLRKGKSELKKLRAAAKEVEARAVKARKSKRKNR